MRAPWSFARALSLAVCAAGAAAGCLMKIDESLLDARAVARDGGARDGGEPDARVESDASSSAPYRETVLADKPIAYWRLGDRGAGSDGGPRTARDEVESFPGAYSAAVALGVPGAIGNDPDTAAHFEIANSSTLVIRAAPLRFVGRVSFSAEAWVRPTITEASCVVSSLGRWQDQALRFGHEGWALHLDDRRRPRFDRRHGYETDASSVEQVVADAPISLDTYAHVVGVHDAQAGQITLYVDAKAFGPIPSTLVTEYQLQELGIGTYTFPSLDWACARSDIDDVAIYDRPLTAEEVLRHHRAGTR